jgi:hypothetical protein
MTGLKLGKLPDRTQVKYTVSAWQELASTLDQYAKAYQAAYGVSEPVAELIPYMLDSFLKSDRWFLAAIRATSPSSPPSLGRSPQDAAS